MDESWKSRLANRLTKNEFQEGLQQNEQEQNRSKKLQSWTWGGVIFAEPPVHNRSYAKPTTPKADPSKATVRFFWFYQEKPLGIRLCSETCSFFFFICFGARKKKEVEFTVLVKCVSNIESSQKFPGVGHIIWGSTPGRKRCQPERGPCGPLASV